MADTPSPAPPRPLGYWLKAADEALTRAIDAAHQADGITRLQWQVLHTIQQTEPTPLPALMTAVRHFGPLDQIPELLEEFDTRGWIVTTVSGPRGLTRFGLTLEGRAHHDALLTRQEAIRRRTMVGISPEEYAVVLRVLERVVRNLEPGGGSAP